MLRLHFAVRLQKFVERHRVDHFVVNTLWLPARICAPPERDSLPLLPQRSGQTADGTVFDALAGSKVRRW